MTPTRPYLVRAFHDWIVDNGMTPYLLVDARVPGVRVPESYVRNGRIVLNVANEAVAGLALGVVDVTFHARFSGVEHGVCLPVSSIMAIYARENGQGMFFSDEDSDGPVDATDDGSVDAPRTRPHLRVVK